MEEGVAHLKAGYKRRTGTGLSRPVEESASCRIPEDRIPMCPSKSTRLVVQSEKGGWEIESNGSSTAETQWAANKTIPSLSSYALGMGGDQEHNHKKGDRRGVGGPEESLKYVLAETRQKNRNRGRFLEVGGEMRVGTHWWRYGEMVHTKKQPTTEESKAKYESTEKKSPQTSKTSN